MKSQKKVIHIYKYIIYKRNFHKKYYKKDVKKNKFNNIIINQNKNKIY